MTIKINGTNTTAQPSITGTDTDTGLVYGTDEVSIVTGGTERVKVNNTGMGVGTTAPEGKLGITHSLNSAYGTTSRNNGFLQVRNSSTTSGCYAGIEIAAQGSGNDSITQLTTVDTGSGNTDFVVGLRSGSAFTEKARFQNGGGISFNGDTAAANALDDYEEGTWTPDLLNGGVMSAVHNASYVKIGNWVEASFYINISSIPNDSNQFQIGGLPYTSKGSNYFPVGNIGFASTFNIDVWRPLINQASTYIYFHRVDGSSLNFTNANAQGLPTLLLSIGYCTT